MRHQRPMPNDFLMAQLAMRKLFSICTFSMAILIYENGRFVQWIKAFTLGNSTGKFKPNEPMGLCLYQEPLNDISR